MLVCGPITHDSLLSGNLNKTEGVQALGVGGGVGEKEHVSDMKSELSVSSTDDEYFLFSSINPAKISAGLFDKSCLQLRHLHSSALKCYNPYRDIVASWSC